MSQTTHESASEHDDDGWYIPTCSCGWKFGPVPDDETATDCLMDHAYEEGRKVLAEELADARAVEADLRAQLAALLGVTETPQ